MKNLDKIPHAIMLSVVALFVIIALTSAFAFLMK
jgi:hypothetical protein